MGRVNKKKKNPEIWSYPRPREPSEGPLTSGEFFGVQPDLWASSEEGGPAEMLGCSALSPHLEPTHPSSTEADLQVLTQAARLLAAAFV